MGHVHSSYGYVTLCEVPELIGMQFNVQAQNLRHGGHPRYLWQHTCSVILCLGGMLIQVSLAHTVSTVMECLHQYLSPGGLGRLHTGSSFLLQQHGPEAWAVWSTESPWLALMVWIAGVQHLEVWARRCGTGCLSGV